MIKPTIGRIVWFWPNAADQGQPQAAVIAHVWSDTCVNLAVFNSDGVATNRTSVLLHQEGSERPISSFAEWMPYQKGQAGKTEALERLVRDTGTPGIEAPAQSVEQEIQSKGLLAPRVTPQMIDEAIIAEQFHVFPGTTLTVCCLTLRNGFHVTGESACASRENFDAGLGERIARDNAKQKIWALEGYLLRSKLAAAVA